MPRMSATQLTRWFQTSKTLHFHFLLLSTRSDEEIFIPPLLNTFCTLCVCLPNSASFPFCFPHFSHCVTFCNWQEVRTSYLRTTGYYETLSNTELSSEIYIFSCNMYPGIWISNFTLMKHRGYRPSREIGISPRNFASQKFMLGGKLISSCIFRYNQQHMYSIKFKLR